MKDRRPILTEEVAIRIRELAREICSANDVQILRGHISRDHVHMFVSVPPSVSANKLMRCIKGTDGASAHNEAVLGRTHLGEGIFCGG